MPKVAEELKESEYWIRLREWLDNGGYAIVAAWARDYVKLHGAVVTGIHAPLTDSKQEVIEASMSVGERMIFDLGENIAALDVPTIVRLDQIQKWLQVQKSGIKDFGLTGKHLLETPERISAILRGQGLKSCAKRFKTKNERFRIISNVEIDEKVEWEAVEFMCVEPRELMDEQKFQKHCETVKTALKTNGATTGLYRGAPAPNGKPIFPDPPM
jgi:hypothetical protein